MGRGPESGEGENRITKFGKLLGVAMIGLGAVLGAFGVAAGPELIAMGRVKIVGAGALEKVLKKKK